MKRSVFVSALIAGGFAGSAAAGRLLPFTAVARWERRNRAMMAMAGIPGRCQASLRENPWRGYDLEQLLT